MAAATKDNINEMIRNLKDTTLKNSDRIGSKTNLAKFSRMLQGQRNMLTVGRLILSELAPVVSAKSTRFLHVDTRRNGRACSLLGQLRPQEAKRVGRKCVGEGCRTVGLEAENRPEPTYRTITYGFVGFGRSAPLGQYHRAASYLAWDPALVPRVRHALGGCLSAACGPFSEAVRHSAPFWRSFARLT